MSDSYKFNNDDNNNDNDNDNDSGVDTDDEPDMHKTQNILGSRGSSCAPSMTGSTGDAMLDID